MKHESPILKVFSPYSGASSNCSSVRAGYRSVRSCNGFHLGGTNYASFAQQQCPSRVRNKSSKYCLVKPASYTNRSSHKISHPTKTSRKSTPTNNTTAAVFNQSLRDSIDCGRNSLRQSLMQERLAGMKCGNIEKYLNSDACDESKKEEYSCQCPFFIFIFYETGSCTQFEFCLFQTTLSSFL